VSNCVWLVIGMIVVAVRSLRVVVGIVMVVGRIVASEGWVLLKMVLRGNAIVYWCVVVCTGCGGWLPSCVVNRFLASLRLWLAVPLGIIFPLQNRRTILLVPLSRAIEMAVCLQCISLVGSILVVVFVVILASGGG
jgi:hypothetical protein